MKFEEFDLSLKWPLELFVWEGKRVLALQPDAAFTAMVETLLDEAFFDGDIASTIVRGDSSAWARGSGGSALGAREILANLLAEPRRLRAYVEPQYWIERKGGVDDRFGSRSFALEFHDLIDEMSETGYFPKVFPKGCVDAGFTHPDELSASISRAIHAEVVWPGDFIDSKISSDVLFSVIEFFHDNAQRPRWRTVHAYADCGYHYEGGNKESGGVVYRWRVNQLLGAHGVGLRLGSKGDEKGRLIRHSSLNLDELEESLAEEPADVEEQKVATAIRLFRTRSSSVTERRAAIAVLAGYLERHREAFKAAELSRGDEGALFNIFNSFAIRHNKKADRQEYGEEYLDWIYWVTLAAIQLLKELNKRSDAK